MNLLEFHCCIYFSGCYFAQDAKYSNEFTGKCETKSMFMCRVLVGDYTEGHRRYTIPPFRDEEKTLTFDSCVDKLDQPSIFVIFDKNQIYPEYLIQYKEDLNMTQTIHVKPANVPAKQATKAPANQTQVTKVPTNQTQETKAPPNTTGANSTTLNQVQANHLTPNHSPSNQRQTTKVGTNQISASRSPSIQTQVTDISWRQTPTTNSVPHQFSTPSVPHHNSVPHQFSTPSDTT